MEGCVGSYAQNIMLIIIFAMIWLRPSTMLATSTVSGMKALLVLSNAPCQYTDSFGLKFPMQFNSVVIC